MRNIFFPTPLKLTLRSILVVAVSVFSLSIGSTHGVHAKTKMDTNTCGQLLAQAEESFLATLAKDGSVPATPETKAAAQEYIRVSKLCYEEIQVQNSSSDLIGGTPSYIDDGGLFFDNGPSAQFVFPNNKWGTSTPGTPGGTVTYSFMGNGISFSDENTSYGNSAAITSLPNFQPCFINDIQAAFAAWEAVANIHFVQVTDSGSAFNAAGASGDIRIGAHYFDGPSGVLAHAYYPPPNGTSAAGDMHFDKSENWVCNSNGIDIGVVAMHEIGHTLGLAHENTSTIAVMDPVYNPSLYTLQSDDINGAVTIYGATLAAPPANDEFGNPTIFSSIPFTDSIDTTGASSNPSDPEVNIVCGDGLLRKGDKNVWYRYDAGSSNPVSIDTIGSNYDTYIAVWKGSALGSLTIVGCNDDTENNLQSQLVLNPQAGTSYYIEVAGYSGLKSGSDETNPGGMLKFNVRATNTDISIGGTLMNRYVLPSGGRITPQYPVVNGPTKVLSTNATNVFASERVHNGNGFVNELMGIPNNQLTSEYWFPWYDNKSMTTWILVGNPSTSQTAHVRIYIAGAEQPGSPYTIIPGDRITPTYSVQNGPVHIVSDINVFTSMRVHTGQGFVNELAGIPNNKLTTQYWFTWYDNRSMQSWILIGNPSTNNAAHVHLYIAGVEQPGSPYTISPGGVISQVYPVLNGPVKIVSDIDVFTTQRVHNATGFINEAAGIPNNQLTSEYWFPWYDNQSMTSWILVGNPSTSQTATVHIYIAGAEQPGSPYTIIPGDRITPTYNILNGPVHIVSDIDVFASERVHTGQGFVNEAAGIPNNQLTTQYWFPWYDNQYMQSWILVGKP